MPDTTHQCPGPKCAARISRTKLMCPAHWAQVPPGVQREVYAAWARGQGLGTERHAAAIRAAIAAVTP